MRKSFITSLRLQIAGAAVALLLTSSVATAQPSDGGESPLDRPTATAPPASAPPASTPAASPTPPPAATTAPATGGPKATGLVIQVKFGGVLNVDLGIGGGGLGDSRWSNGGLLIGYKMDRLVLGVGLDLNHVGHRYKTFTGTGLDDAVDSLTVMLFSPTLEYFLAVSNPLALYMTVGLHAGFWNFHQDPGEDDSGAAIGFHAGLGIRYFLHPRFAIGVEGGCRGVWLFFENDDSTDDDNENYGSLSVYGAVALTAIW